MAKLTPAQIAAIKKQVPKNMATKAALQSTKISNVQAGAAGEKIRQGVAPRYRGVAPGTAAMSPSARATGKSQAQKNADLEKQRRYAKGEKPLSPKERVGTKAEYKALGQEIKLKAALHKKAVDIDKAKAAKAAADAKAAAMGKAEPKKAVTPKKAAKAPTAPPEAPKTPSTPKMDAKYGNMAQSRVPVTPPKPEAKPTAPKPAAKPKVAKKPVEPKKSAPKTEPKVGGARGSGVAAQGGLNTAEEVDKYKAAQKAGKTKGESIRIAKEGSTPPKAAAPKPPSTEAVKTTTAAPKTDAPKAAPKAADAPKKPGKFAKAGKVLKIATKAGVVIGVGKEANQVFSGQAEKDFIRIQKLENQLAAEKGQKPKFTTLGSGWNKNLVESVKGDLGAGLKAVSLGMVGKDRKDRIAELTAKLKPASATAPTAKPATSGTPGAIKGTYKAPTGGAGGGNVYRVEHGDTLSGIAAKAGVSLANLRAANPQLAGKDIFRNTPVKMPGKAKAPSGGYTGAVPYKAPAKAKTTPTKPKVVTKPVTKPMVTPTGSFRKYPTAQ